MSLGENKLDQSKSEGGFRLNDLEIHKTIGTGEIPANIDPLFQFNNNTRNFRLCKTL